MKAKYKQQPSKSNKVIPSPDQLYFKYFVIGSITFMLGLGSVVYVNLVMPPSTKQETIAAIGLVLAIPGALMAIYYYFRLLIGRFKQFIDK